MALCQEQQEAFIYQLLHCFQSRGCSRPLAYFAGRRTDNAVLSIRGLDLDQPESWTSVPKTVHYLIITILPVHVWTNISPD